MGEIEVQMQVTNRRDLADSLVQLEMSPVDEGVELPVWQPGDHVELVLDDGLVRQYSLCGDPQDQEMWRIAVLKVSESRGGSERVHADMSVGTALTVRGPRHRFPLVDAKRYVFIAGGIGITPLVPMLVTADRAGTPWKLYYGGRSLESMAYHRGLVMAHGEHVQIHPEDELGLLPLADILAAADADTAVYCCGPESLIKDTEALADGQPWSLHVERFTTDGPVPLTSEDGPIDVHLELTGSSVTVAADETVLEALEREGVFVLSSCREGICGTCETRVLGGKPDHRDFYLTDEEREAGDVMMVCVSRSLDGTLNLEL
jgi:ferredoxin-NADP reductase